MDTLALDPSTLPDIQGDVPLPVEIPPVSPREIEEIEKCLVQLIASKFEASKRLMREHHERWAENLRINSGETLNDTALSDVSIQITRNAVVTWLKHQFDGMLSDSAFFEFEPVRPEDQASADAHTMLARHQIREGGIDQELLDRALFHFDALGNTVVRVFWDRQEGVRKASRTVLVPIPDPVTGLPSGRFVEQEEEVHETYQICSRPSIRTVSLFSIYPSQTNVEKISECDCVIETSVVDYGSLWQARRREAEVDVQGMKVRRRVGMYLGIERLDPASASEQPSHGAGQDITAIGDDDGASKSTGFAKKEAWIKLDLGAVLAQMRGGDGEAGERKRYRPQAIVAFAEKWGLNLAQDMEPGGWWVIETIDDRHLIRLERNPYPFDQLPYLSIQFFIRPGMLWGDGLYDVSKGASLALNSIVSAGVDAARMITQPMVLYDDSALAEQFGAEQDLIGSYVPWKGIRMRGMGALPLDAMFKPFAPPYQILQAAFEVQNQLTEIIRDETGSNVDAPGAGVGPRATAREVSEVSSQQYSRIAYQNNRFESQIIEPMLDMFALMNRRNLTLPEAISVAGPDGALVAFTIRPEWLQGDVRAHAKGSTELTNRLVKSQAMANQLAILAPLGITVNPEWGREIVRNGQLGDPRRLIVSDEQYYMMQQAAAMASAAGGEGGGGPGQIPVLESESDIGRSQLNA